MKGKGHASSYLIKYLIKRSMPWASRSKLLPSTKGREISAVDIYSKAFNHKVNCDFSKKVLNKIQTSLYVILYYVA